MMSVSPARIRALLAKEALELRAGPGVLVLPLVMLLAAVVLPLATITIVPAWSGERLDSAGDVVALARHAGGAAAAGLSDEAAVQAFLLLQFLPLLALVPVVGAMTLITTSIVGEKQARTLEPLLATPLSAPELLLAKTAAAAAVAMALNALGTTVLLGMAGLVGEPGVVGALVSPRALALVFGAGPAATLMALTLGAVVSTRARDARAAQQAGVVVVLPFVGAFVAGLTGSLALTASGLLVAAAVMLALAAALGLLAVRLFDRERMLTDWT